MEPNVAKIVVTAIKLLILNMIEEKWIDKDGVMTIVGNFLHFWSLARHKTKFQISCETCKTARLEEFPIFSVIFKFLARKCS